MFKTTMKYVSLINFLKKFTHCKVLILCHQNADVDAVASAFALKKLLEKINIENVDIGAAKSVSKHAKKFLDKLGIYELKINPDLESYDLIILLDTSSKTQVEPLNISKVSDKLVVIDHHTFSQRIDAKVAVIDEDASSTSELIYEIWKETKINIDKEAATLILAGILADTAFLKYATPRSLEIVKEISELGINIDDVKKMLSEEMDLSEKMARLLGVKRAKISRVGNLVVTFSLAKSHEASVAKALIDAGADLAFVFNVDKKTKICARARIYAYNVGVDLGKLLVDLAKFFGGEGGGHSTAGGATLDKNININTLEESIKMLIEKYTRKGGENEGGGRNN